jgi:hypothetical protein
MASRRRRPSIKDKKEALFLLPTSPAISIAVHVGSVYLDANGALINRQGNGRRRGD